MSPWPNSALKTCVTHWHTQMESAREKSVPQCFLVDAAPIKFSKFAFAARSGDENWKKLNSDFKHLPKGIDNVHFGLKVHENFEKFLENGRNFQEISS